MHQQDRVRYEPYQPGPAYPYEVAGYIHYHYECGRELHAEPAPEAYDDGHGHGEKREQEGIIHIRKSAQKCRYHMDDSENMDYGVRLQLFHRINGKSVSGVAACFKQCEFSFFYGICNMSAPLPE